MSERSTSRDTGRAGEKSGAAPLRRLHRWLGLGTLLFILLLSVTGIALNHTGDLRLDERYVSAPWLLDWYGIKVPPPDASFDSGNGRVTLLGERLYLDDREIARSIESLLGAVAWREHVVVATSDALLAFTPIGELASHAQLPGGYTAIDRVGVRLAPHGSARPQPTERLVVATADELLAYDEERGELRPDEPPGDDVQWSTPSEIPSELNRRIAELYRGEGVTWARVLYDLHSGRLFSTAGTLTMDTIGVLLVLLSLAGLVLWLGGRRASNRNRA